ncbi:Dyp-type peroxidase [Actinoplanes sp. NPDC023801]|uniref:Dyp-type peroxidase n=1 Tax=Actinoplanes sp. NPDC023801 TaxID=3154595 RepID=UPI0034061CDF
MTGPRRRTVLAAGLTSAAAGLTGCSDPAPPPVQTAPSVLTGNPVVVAPVRRAAVLTAYDVTAAELAAPLSALEEHLRGTAATIAVGASLFDGRFTIDRPRLLSEMPAFRADVPDPQWCHGDLLVQAVADDLEQLRALTRPSVPGLRRRWSIEGSHPSAPGPGTRNAFGFQEGLGNPDAADRQLMGELIWVQPGDGEPAWCTGGTYQVVRLIQMAMPTWDSDPVVEQERVIGRHKDTGAPLSGQRQTDEPDLDGEAIAVDAHIRLANPRTPDSMAHRILRHGYTYRLSAENTGQIFICYQRDVEKGFATIQRRLAGEALERYLLPFGGGYFFVLPPAGVRALIG